HIYSHLLLHHGETARAIGFQVKNCEAFYTAAMQNGACSIEVPTEYSDGSGTYIRAAIATYGDTIHPIIERTEYTGCFAPGFVPFEGIFDPIPVSQDVGLLRIDHIVGNVELGKMEHWVRFYEKVLGFHEMTHFTDEDISTEYSALMSKVLANGNNKIKFPINEPAQGRRKSQIEEYLDFHRGPGVQHIALLTGDIIQTVTKLRENGVQFLSVPKAYYESLPTRIGEIDEKFEEIANLGILADRDDDGYLLQLFTKPVQDRPTLFFEIIQRHGSQGFGIGNFKALFEAIEREQARRGNL
ncbi:MAG: 4-hydroxyphenylpyruvate dioxygenase, partial [Bdellovibrionales bacterium]|nr:4-hydroxyphenylpyruvate dioxygenase [Bdellovibrionales bacterium]